MARFDGSVSASFDYQGRAGPFASGSRTICRHDDRGCIADLTAQMSYAHLRTPILLRHDKTVSHAHTPHAPTESTTNH